MVAKRRCTSFMTVERKHQCALRVGHIKRGEPHWAHLAANVVLRWVGAPRKIYGGMYNRLDGED